MFFLRRYIYQAKEGVWPKVLTLSSSLFFIMLADAIVSFWAPNLLQDTLKSPVLMGLVIGFQSVIGFSADLIFPKLLKNASVRWLVLTAIFTSAATLLFIFGSTFKPLLPVFLIAMALWGTYYEFEGFAQNQFVADSVPVEKRSGVWGVMGVFRNLAYFLGPLLAAWLLLRGNVITAGVGIIFLLIGLVIILAFGKHHEKNPEVDVTKINIWQEIKRWISLAKHIWPIILMSLILGFIDSTFWTTGAVFTEGLAKQSFWGGLFLPLYSLPSLFIGFVVAKWGIFKGKKRLALKFMLLASVFLIALGFLPGIPLKLIMVLLFGLAISVTYPLIEGVYSDISARMGSQKKHIFGLTGSAVNLSYIVWPAMAGFITTKVGEAKTFSVMGALTFVVALVLLLIIPKKLKLPQKEIGEWKKEDK